MIRPPVAIAALLFSLLINSNALAAPRQLLAADQGALANRGDPAVTQVLSTLKSKAESAGAVRIIVGMRVPFAAESSLAGPAAQAQRGEIAAAQAVLLRSVPSLGSKPPGRIKQFQTIPFLALEVDSNELAALAALPEVLSITEDELAAPVLLESVPLVGGSSAWAAGYTGAGQTIAILDTGVDKTHSFLTGKVVSEACYSTTDAGYAASSVCPGGSNSTASDSGVPCSAGVSGCDHGTHVAGVAAGSGDTFSGVAKNANIIAIQVFSRIDSSFYCNPGLTPCALSFASDQILALERVYALRDSFRIAAVNMSIGGGRYYSNCDATETARKAAIDNLRAAKIATVIASGNNAYSDSMSAPGCISTAISVGATTEADSVASYSNSASFLHLLAPGSSITSSVPGGAYDTWNGTSMATPHVAGAMALLRHKRPSLSVDDALAALSTTGLAIVDGRNGLSKPRIRIMDALDSIPRRSQTPQWLILLLD